MRRASPEHELPLAGIARLREDERMNRVRLLLGMPVLVLALGACSRETAPNSGSTGAANAGSGSAKVDPSANANPTPSAHPAPSPATPSPKPAAAAKTQLFGWLHKKSDGSPAPAGKLAIQFEDHHVSNLSAADTHALLLHDPSSIVLSNLEVAVQSDGGFVAELPPKSWVASVQYFPKPEHSETSASGMHLVHSTLIATRHEVDQALESGALEIAFEIDSGLAARGRVLDARTRQPLADALVVLESVQPPLPMAKSAADGGFALVGLDPRELQPRDGLLLVRAEAAQHETVTQTVPWKEGEELPGALEILLPPKSP